MKTKTQRQIIIEQLKANGYISRNWCLQNFITRLGAIICQMKKEGFVFTVGYNNGNYEYHLVQSPMKKVQDVELRDGKAFISYHEEPLIKIQ